MKEIFLLVDYQGHFGNKQGAIPYRSGLVREKLSMAFGESGYRAVFMNFSDVDFRSGSFKDRDVMYTSTEDYGLHYKAFIEDVVMGLEECGARVVPPYKYLRAHHNKVFMEILRDQMPGHDMKALSARSFGTREELVARLDSIALPCVVKPAAGAMSNGVRLCKTRDELLRAASAVSASPHWPTDAWEFGRKLRRRGYLRASRHRQKFLVQSFLPGLDHDWKVLVYGSKYFALLRRTRNDDFRASGSGRFEFTAAVPAEILNCARSIFHDLDVPHLSLDLGVTGSKVHMFEFQATYFGTQTIEKAPFYFTKSDEAWKRVDGTSDVEEEFVRSVVDHIERRPGVTLPRSGSS